MRVRQMVAALVVVFALGVFAAPALAAGTVTYPSSITYGDEPTLKMSGLKANTAYNFVLYDSSLTPLFVIPFTSGADGSFSIPQFGPEQTDLPGAYTFAVLASDFSSVAATAHATLTGTSRYFDNKRLGVS